MEQTRKKQAIMEQTCKVQAIIKQTWKEQAINQTDSWGAGHCETDS